jgi:hypothetical protein
MPIEEAHRARQPGPAADVLENDGRCRGREIGEAEGLHHAVWRLDFEELAVKLEDVAGGVALLDAPLAAGPHVHFADRIGIAPWPPPLGEMVGIDHRLPNQFDRRFEHAGDQNDGFTGRCSDGGCCHFSLRGAGPCSQPGR